MFHNNKDMERFTMKYTTQKDLKKYINKEQHKLTRDLQKHISIHHRTLNRKENHTA